MNRCSLTMGAAKNSYEPSTVAAAKSDTTELYTQCSSTQLQYLVLLNVRCYQFISQLKSTTFKTIFQDTKHHTDVGLANNFPI